VVVGGEAGPCQCIGLFLGEHAKGAARLQAESADRTHHVEHLLESRSACTNFVAIFAIALKFIHDRLHLTLVFVISDRGIINDQLSCRTLSIHFVRKLNDLLLYFIEEIRFRFTDFRDRRCLFNFS